MVKGRLQQEGCCGPEEPPCPLPAFRCLSPDIFQFRSTDVTVPSQEGRRQKGAPDSVGSQFRTRFYEQLQSPMYECRHVVRMLAMPQVGKEILGGPCLLPASARLLDIEAKKKKRHFIPQSNLILGPRKGASNFNDHLCTV